jgi:hypothetical protein
MPLTPGRQEASEKALLLSRLGFSSPVEDPKYLASDLRFRKVRMPQTDSCAARIADSFAQISGDFGASLRADFAIEPELDGMRS